jgi:hypothetical protein
MCAKEG